MIIINLIGIFIKMLFCDLDVCDIEDVVKKDDFIFNDRIIFRGVVLLKVRVKFIRNNLNELFVGDSIISGI